MDCTQWSISSQGRVLCQRYIIQRSLKAGAQLKKVRMLFDTLSDNRVTNEIAEKLLEIIRIMELLNPSIYDSCSAKLKLTMTTDEQVRWTYERITSELLKTGVNWGKLISIFTVCGALASDCVLQGHTDFLPVILDCFEESCSQAKLHRFLKSSNGWSGIVGHYDNITEGHGPPSRDTVTSVANKSIRLVQSLSSRFDLMSVAMLVFFIFVITMSLTKYISQATKMSP